MSTPTAPPSSSSGASPGRRGCPTCCALPSCRRTSSSSCARAHPTPRDPRGGRGTHGRPARPAGRGGLDPGGMLPRGGVTALLSAATVFACPSVYEPLGIVNLEAMACELPVVAAATGGIPEVVVPGETGWLVPIEQVRTAPVSRSTRTPSSPTSRRPWSRPSATRPGRPDGPGRAPARRRRLLVGEHRRPDDAGLPRGAAWQAVS